MDRRGRRDKPGAEGSAAYREGLEAGAGGGGVGRGAPFLINVGDKNGICGIYQWDIYLVN